MKICTITCHDVYNYGASLQAYALKTHLAREGHEVSIIDYKPDYLSGHYRFMTVASPRWEKSWLHKTIYLVLKLPGRLLALPRKWAFDRFTRKYLPLTPIHYASNNNLKKNPPAAEAYICGSDQIWNCQFPNGRDPAFYLDFAPQGKRKLAYAASFAMDALPQELMPVLKERINRLDAISVRETDALRLLQELGITRGVQVVDPVFLLERQYWEAMATLEPHERYILVYSFDNEAQISAIARRLAVAKKCKLYSVNPHPFKGANKNWNYASPTDFLGLIMHAEHVVTNSFHAVAFALIFHREFTVTGREEKLNSRMLSLLQSLGIQERYLLLDAPNRQAMQPIDYVNIDESLQRMTARSREFLRVNLREGA